MAIIIYRGIIADDKRCWQNAGMMPFTFVVYNILYLFSIRTTPDGGWWYWPTTRFFFYDLVLLLLMTKDKGILSFHTLGSYFNWIPWFLIMLIILLKYELCSKIYILRHLFQIGSDDTKVYKTLHIYEFQPHILKSKPSICRKTTTIVNDEFVCRQIARSRFLFH